MKKQNSVKKLFVGLLGSFNAKLEITIPISFYTRTRLKSSYYWFEYHGNEEVVTINCIPSSDRDREITYPFIIQLTNECNNIEETLKRIWSIPFYELTPDDCKMKCNDLFFVAKLINHAIIACDACEVTLITR